MKPTTSLQHLAGLLLAAAIGIACAPAALGPAPTPTPTATLPPTASATPAPTDTLVPTATVLPTATPRPTKTATPSPTPTPDWPSVLFYDFGSRSRDWSTGDANNEFGTSSRAIVDGVYRWEVAAAQNMYLDAWPDSTARGDMRVDVDAAQLSGAAENSYGLLFRQSGDNSGYSFEIADDGWFIVWRLGANGGETLIDWTESTAIRNGQANHLSVIAQGTHFAFFVNDVLVGEADDGRWPTGQAGLIASLYNAGDQGTFTFDNFEVRAPGESAAPATPAGSQAVAQATAQAESLAQRVQQLVDDRVLTSGEGAYHPLGDFDQSLAMLNYYEPFPTGYSPTDFVVRADAAWESASRTADWWNSGCGFVFRSDSKGTEYVAFLGLDGNVYLARFDQGNYNSLGSSYYGKLDVPSGEAQLMLAVQGSQINFFVNDVLVHSRKDATLATGALAYTLVSGTNKDYGTHCTLTNVELWELK